MRRCKAATSAVYNGYECYDFFEQVDDSSLPAGKVRCVRLYQCQLVWTQRSIMVLGLVDVSALDASTSVGESGVLTVSYSGRSGTVCGTSFGNAEANAACKSMGYARGEKAGLIGGFMYASELENFKQLNDLSSVVLTNVRCAGYEEHLEECQSQWSSSCGFENSVRVACYKPAYGGGPM